LWSWIMFSPFLLFIHLFVLLRRFVKNEPLYTDCRWSVCWRMAFFS
jgi:hypothetical protein